MKIFVSYGGVPDGFRKLLEHVEPQYWELKWSDRGTIRNETNAGGRELPSPTGFGLGVARENSGTPCMLTSTAPYSHWREQSSSGHPGLSSLGVQFASCDDIPERCESHRHVT